MPIRSRHIWESINPIIPTSIRHSRYGWKEIKYPKTPTQVQFVAISDAEMNDSKIYRIHRVIQAAQ